jgi:hypothetical protein
VPVSAYLIYRAYLAELRSAVDFCRAAALLRPRLNEHLRWETADPPARKMFQDFLAAQPSEARVFQSVVVSLHAGFEQFVLDLIDDGAEAISDRRLSHGAFEGKFPGAAKKFRQASGSALVSIFEPRSHWKIDYDELIRCLASTHPGSPEVAIYGRSFGVRKGNLSWDELNKLLEGFGFEVPWGDISKDSALQLSLGTRNKAATEVALKARMTKLLELRNSLAHSQGAEEVEYVQVVEFLTICDNLCRLLSDAFMGFVRAA